MEQGQSYYAGIANDCDKLVAQNILNGSDERKLPGNDASLPAGIRDLRPNDIVIVTNAVLVCVGVGRESYRIVWSRNSVDDSQWDLSANIEGSRKIVYSRKSN